MSNRLSVSLALDSLRDVVGELDTARLEVDRLMRERDRLIRDARDNGIGVSRITRETGLGRDRIYAITHARLEVGA